MTPFNVICINNKPLPGRSHNAATTILEEGEMYTVVSIKPSDPGFPPAYRLEGVKPYAFCSSRFVPCGERDERYIKVNRMTEVTLNGKKMFLHTCFLEFLERIKRGGYHPEWAKDKK